MLRFTGVLRPKAKLRAFTEPFVEADYRLHLGIHAGWGRCIGGAIKSVHSGIRADLDRTMEAYALCELLQRLTPLAQPSPAKHDLMVEALEVLDTTRPPWLRTAYTLRLLDLAGHRVPAGRWSDADRRFWADLHEGPLAEAAALPDDDGRRGRFLPQIDRVLQLVLDRPLKGPEFAASVEKEKEAA